MSKLTNTVKKGTIWSVILGVILVAAIVVGAMFGVNKATAVKDAETLTVTVNRFAYATQEETILSECEDAFADAVKILQARLQQYVNHELPGVQAGFRKGKGT